MAGRSMVAVNAGVVLAALLANSGGFAADNPPDRGDAKWIWTAQQQPAQAPPGVCYFRKLFNLRDPENGHIEIACDNRYELYVNGRLLGKGDDWRRLDRYDLRGLLVNGLNVIAVKAQNDAPGPAGLVARVIVRQKGNTDISHSTDHTWLCSNREVRNWQVSRLREQGWTPAQEIGELGAAGPWKNQVAAGDVGHANGSRFMVAPSFRVERVAQPDATGSLIAMAFNERGEIIAARERGPLIRVRDEDGDGAPEAVTPFCDKVTGCQGILPLNGDVFVVGDGPDKAALYRISDEDGDGVGETIKTLLKFRGGMGEHGPHAVVLGPDGLLYVMIGNHAGLDVAPDATSPHGHYYEGDLVQPRYEDAGGHAVGIKAPGGTVIRTSIDGGYAELFAGGFRNAYDMAFNKHGDLFTFDSDMEWDEGLPWYRPTRVNHVIPGAEFGWRSGWANWPDYFVDSLPATINIGRGSPTGVECYSHYRYPVRYHNALFLGDWSLGRIIVVRMEPADGTYIARSEVFLQGRPLNVTDLAVGPDGWLYFTTGGRDTEGGIYRVIWTGNVPPRPKEPGIIEAIRQPQLASAWGRNRVANIRREMGPAWDAQLLVIVEDPRYAVDDRIRALDLMQLVGPSPTAVLLEKLSHDSEAAIRAKAAELMGIHVDELTSQRLVELLEDSDPMVRRESCEAMVRGQCLPAPAQLLPLLAEPRPYVAWAAMRALQTLPRQQWQDLVLQSPEVRVYLMGAVALLGLDLDRATCDKILARGEELLPGFLSDKEFVDLLRVFQVALARGAIPPGEARTLTVRLAEEYPALEPQMNRELIRLLVYLDEPSVVPRLLDELSREDNAIEEKLHLALYARFMKTGWSCEQKLAVLRFYEYARTLPGGHSYRGYIDNTTRDFIAQMTDDERWDVIVLGHELPNAALMALAKLPPNPGAEKLTVLIGLDRQLAGAQNEAASRLGTGIVAVLGRSQDPEAMSYLREVFEQQPERRQDAAMGLAQDPRAENWTLLVRALPVLEGPAAQEVLTKLATVDQRPERPEDLRQAILAGLRLKEAGGKQAVALLEKWTGEQLSRPEDTWEVALATWQSWFVAKYPDQPAPNLPQAAEGTKWSLEQILDHLNSEAARSAVPQRGSLVYEKAQCAKCHKFGGRGEAIGPDLSGIARRFQKREILESVLFPSHVISDQYASKTVVTTDGLTLTGIVGASGPNAVVVHQANGEHVVVPNENIEQIVPSNKSSMPEGLFDALTLEDIADLFAYLSQPPPAN
jgi:putative heme-binding domain-containing protein